MLNQNPEIQILLRSAERVFNFRTSTSSDFECLSVHIYQNTHHKISSSTLKRLWGYIKYNYTPRESTLDVLAKYTGHSSYKDFCENNSYILESASLFFSNNQVDSISLTKGATVTVCWDPDRYVKFEKIDDLNFKVSVSINSKLKEGDKCYISSFIEGHPLLVTNIERSDIKLKAYIAGKQKGVKIIEVKRPDYG